MENNYLNQNTNLTDMLNDKNKTVHFIGLGGVGMSGLARVLLNLGFKVSGSDIKCNETVSKLKEIGANVFIGHKAENVQNAACIIASSAIKKDNPEVVEAIKLNIPIFHRSKLLNVLMQGLGLDKKQISIGVAGTHGKTTTSGMLSLVFEECKLDPSFVVGGKMPLLGVNSKFGKGNFFIAELDESDGTIVSYTPDVTIITNLEYDHPDHYVNGFEQIIETFTTYINNLKPESKIIINFDSPGNRELISKNNHKGIILYSTDESNKQNVDYYVKNIQISGLKSKAEIYQKDKYITTIDLSVPGNHNISNSIAVIAAGIECNINTDSMVKALSLFTGMGRRFQIVGEVNGAKIIDDYAHHPTEIQTTLNAAKKYINSLNKGRVIVAFQPHRYSRLEYLWNDFLKSFSDADEVYLCDVYPAGESPIKDINSENLSKNLHHKNVYYIPGNMEQVADKIYKNLQSDDIILTMGAGDITKLGEFLVKKQVSK